MLSNECIVAANLNKSFVLGQKKSKRSIHVLKDISLSINLGEVVSIVGASGSGKSTLLYCLSTLEARDSGLLKIMNKEIKLGNALSNYRIRRDSISFIFQSYNLIASLSALDNIMLPAMLAGHKIDQEKLNWTLEELGLKGREKSFPKTMSGGEQQRVAIARAIVSEAPIIFADEPTGALDSLNASKALELLRKEGSRADRAIVMVTHDLKAAAVADKVLVLKDGKIVESLLSPDEKDILDILRV